MPGPMVWRCSSGWSSPTSAAPWSTGRACTGPFVPRAPLLIEAGEPVTEVAARESPKLRPRPLQIYGHLWRSSEDQSRLVLSRAFEGADFLRTARDPDPL